MSGILHQSRDLPQPHARPRHERRHAKTDPFHQSCCSLVRWWPGADRIDMLTTYLARQRQLWRLHDEGDGNRTIARELGITEGDVRHHLRRGRAWLQTVAEGIWWLTWRMRNARNTVREEPDSTPGAQWFKDGSTWRNRFFRVECLGQDYGQGIEALA